MKAKIVIFKFGLACAMSMTIAIKDVSATGEVLPPDVIEALDFLAGKIDSTPIIDVMYPATKVSESVVDAANQTVSGPVATTTQEMSKAQAATLALGGAVAGALLIHQTYRFCKWAKSWVVTDREEQFRQDQLRLRQELIDNQREKLRSENIFFNCLVDNADNSLDERGLPQGCKEAAEAYERAWGTKALDDQIEIFNKR